MNDDLLPEVRRRIEADFEFKKTGGEWLQGGKCPACGKKELYAKADNPWVLKCGRLEKCGHTVYVKEEYPDIFNNWSKRYVQTAAAPHAAADAYLKNARGFDIAKLKGLYSQEYYRDHEKGIGSATVRFPIANGGFWERIIDQPERFGSKKAHFNHGANYRGTVWEPPMARPDNEIWFVEGIFDCISLMQHGTCAVTPLSCNNYPFLYLQGIAEQCVQANKKRPKLVFAYDDGKAGRYYMKRHVIAAQTEGWQASAAYIRFEGGKKRDWNDYHLAGGITDELIADARYRGAMLTARSPADKAGIMFRKKAWQSFYFDYDNRLYWFEIDFKKLSEAKEAIRDMAGNAQKTDQEIHDMAMEQSRTVRRIANCKPTPLYYQKNRLTGEAWYYLRIDFPHDGPSVKDSFTGRQLRAVGEFTTRLTEVAAGAIFDGNARHHGLWLEQIEGIKTVDSIDYIGYSKDHKAWIFDKLAVSAGRVIELNDEDFFDVGKRAINSRNKTVNLAINADLTEYDPSWVKALWECFGAQGIVALAYWLGSFFAEQIREPHFHESYPFLEITGEPNAGKSTLIEFLWKLCGRTAYEGFDPAKSSLAGRSRNLVQVSNLPIVCIESDRDKGESDKLKQRNFDWDEFKTAFNGRSVRSLGIKNSGTDTYEPPFRGALVISQNAKVVASDAFMQRIVHIWLEAKPVTEKSRATFKALTGFPVKRCSGFILKAAKAEAEILKTVDERYHEYVRILDDNPAIRQQRVIHCHAQLMALVDALRRIVDFGDDAYVKVLEEIVDMAVERQETINDDPPVVQEFWDVVDYLEDKDDDKPLLNHSRNEREIAINLNEFVAKADAYRQQIPDMRELKKHLRQSRNRPFVAANVTVNSAIHGRSVKCWIFQREDKNRGRGDD